MLADEHLDRWADLLVDYCLALQPLETVSIASEWDAAPLVDRCARRAIRRGSRPIIRLEPPGLREFFLREASPELLEHVSPIELFEAQTVDARIRISAESDLSAAASIDASRQAIRDRALDPVRRAAAKKRWTLTQYPTPAYAQAAKMSLEEYEKFVISAMFLDRSDPIEAWRELGRSQAGLVRAMTPVDAIRIEADGTDLSLSVKGRTWINSDGKRNMPSGEIFTGPIEDSASGRLRCGFPVYRDGREIVGIELEFRDGLVVSARADRGEDYLLAMLDLDSGSRRLGELGIGLNEGIQRFTGSILYDEKIGGTIHVALGRSYPETGGVNESALHWDLIVDLRSGGRLTADGEIGIENGKRVVGS
jgi:aminopeptidase